MEVQGSAGPGVFHEFNFLIPYMNSLPQTIEPELIVRGSRFAMPAVGIIFLIIAGSYIIFAQSNPFMSFGDVFMVFLAPLAALVSMNFTTRAVFYIDRCKVGRTTISYENIAFVNRGRFLLVIRYNRPNEARTSPRRAALSFYEMRRHEQEKCLDILHSRLTEKAVLNSRF
ncbi:MULTISPECIES: hypothetical protein [Paraburkholderia]|uniref:hypothetical protein n=1 Tax=Paraburkholderia TaxID=1822464 RepID=UPI00224F127D|nr:MULTISPECIES: hypothetical protein [Paraburkholderia]MCX4175571.1 hypothetical protein [Paraburkholderia madseniana]MDQ6463568.1 hypothetical protein [Paraburkholderia madseniana]